MKTEQTAITVYPRSIPPFVDRELERLYENVFSSLPYVRIHAGTEEPVSTYVAERNGEPVCILLYTRNNNIVRVQNEGAVLEAAEIQRFADHIFGRMPSVDVIFFNAIRTEPHAFSLPFQRFNCSEDIVVRLPATVEEYFSSLGHATRKNIRRYRNKLARNLPQVRHSVLCGAEIGEEQVREIIRLNTERVLRKKKVPGYDERETERMVQLARACGFVSMHAIDDELIAGELCTCVHDHYFSHVGGLDARYDNYGLGTLGCYLAISEAIRRGGKEFHFLWGQYPYKYSFLGEQRDLQRLTLYRSRTHLYLNGRTALQGALDDGLRKIKLAARERLLPEKSGVAKQFALNVVNQLRSGGRN